MLAKELDDEYLDSVEDHLRRLAFRDGVLMSAGLDNGNKGTRYVLRKPWDTKQGWMERLQARMERLLLRDRSVYEYQIADRDESGFRALSELRGRGISLVASALGQSTDHLLSFFGMLRSELGFYVGCLNLRDRLARKGEPICFPVPFPAGKAIFSGRGLYDLCLSLSVKERVVGNDVNADDKLLVMITGANRGGKSTFLRGIGLAQLMMQCGMFVPAESFRANVCDGIFTHYKREEDSSMKSGKLDEELSRMSSLVDDMTPNSIVLLNESFASTNEREGSEIARQIVRALLETGIKVIYVTHLFDLAHRFYLAKMDAALFLRAERLTDGRRTFRLVEGEPLPTSYGEDLYRRIFCAV
jgi:DNA mismatch repair ATPase MutS